MKWPLALHTARVCRLAIVVPAWLALAAPAAAGSDSPAHALAQGGQAVVSEIVDGDTVVLDDGREVRLVGIQAPKLPLGRRNFKKWPLADRAREELSALVLGRTVTLAYGGQRVDRHGRQLAHLVLPDGGWVQRILLSQGMARVYSFPDNRALVAEMLVAERAARKARAGIWANGYYAIRQADGTGRDIGSFQLVEGVVLETANVRGTTYLNFADDWRSDFTIVIGRKALAMFEAAGIDPLALAGRRVRIRGWLDKRNGPMIAATHPEQIEVLTD